MHDGQKAACWKPWLLPSQWISFRQVPKHHCRLIFWIGLQDRLSIPTNTCVHYPVTQSLSNGPVTKAIKSPLKISVVLLSVLSLQLKRKLLWNGHKMNCLPDSRLLLRTRPKQCSQQCEAPQWLLLTLNLRNFLTATVKKKLSKLSNNRLIAKNKIHNMYASISKWTHLN